jgi:hypothetical protein
VRNIKAFINKFQIGQIIRMASFESRGGVKKITGLCGSLGKRKLSPSKSESPGAKLRKFDINL